jgi:hypothetical protein
VYFFCYFIKYAFYVFSLHLFSPFYAYAHRS